MSQSVDRARRGVVKLVEGKEPVQSERNVRTAQSPEKSTAYEVGFAIAWNIVFFGLYIGYRSAANYFE